jgi:hypothetical protein
MTVITFLSNDWNRRPALEQQSSTPQLKNAAQLVEVLSKPTINWKNVSLIIFKKQKQQLPLPQPPQLLHRQLPQPRPVRQLLDLLFVLNPMANSLTPTIAALIIIAPLARRSLT